VRGVLSQTTEGHRLLSDKRTYLGEARYAVEHEAAVSLADFTMRRTRLALLSAGHGRRDAEAIAKVMAEGLDWSDTELVRQIELHEEELTAEGL
jgi:glycerol-3-phosphate dehydrogenase